MILPTEQWLHPNVEWLYTVPAPLLVNVKHYHGMNIQCKAEGIMAAPGKISMLENRYFLKRYGKFTNLSFIKNSSHFILLSINLMSLIPVPEKKVLI